MGLLQKLKSALGLDGSESRRSGDVDVTVERGPSTEDEDAVKGTETASSGAESESAAPSGSDDTGSGDPAADEFETLAEEADEDDGAADDEPAAETGQAAGSTDAVTELNGIGPAYGDRLADAGIETVGELAGADAADLADRIDLGESRVAGWIAQANDY